MNGFQYERERLQQELSNLRKIASEFDAKALRFERRVENLSPEELPLELQAEWKELRTMTDQLTEQIELVQRLQGH